MDGELENRPAEEWELGRVGMRELGIDRYRISRWVLQALERSRPLVRDALRLGRSLRLTREDLLTRVD